MLSFTYNQLVEYYDRKGVISSSMYLDIEKIEMFAKGTQHRNIYKYSTKQKEIINSKI